MGKSEKQGSDILKKNMERGHFGVKKVILELQEDIKGAGILLPYF